MNWTPPPLSFPVETMDRVIDCSEVVSNTMLPAVKRTLIQFCILGIALNIYQLWVIWPHAESKDMIGSSGSILVYAAILSVVMTFPD